MYPILGRRSYVYFEFFRNQTRKTQENKIPIHHGVFPVASTNQKNNYYKKDVRNDSSLIILDDGRIVWRQSLTENARRKKIAVEKHKKTKYQSTMASSPSRRLYRPKKQL
jgi:hypothetical protein